MKKISSRNRFLTKELNVQNGEIPKRTLQEISFEKSKKIISDSGLNLTDNEIKIMIELAHQLAELIIRNYILK